MTKEQFIQAYCERSKVTAEWFNDYFVALPCACDSDICEGWAKIRNDPESIADHIRFYLPEGFEVTGG